MKKNLKFLKTIAQIKFAGLVIFISMMSNYQVFGANAPFQALTVTTVDGPVGLRNLVFSINDPARGVVTGQTGQIGLSRWEAHQGVIIWVYDERAADQSLHTYAGFSVYDPKSGTWKNSGSRAYDSNDVEGATVVTSGGTVIWYRINSGIRYAFYDPELQSWVFDSDARPISTSIDSTGTVGMRTTNGVTGVVYDPTRKLFKRGFSPSLTGSV